MKDKRLQWFLDRINKTVYRNKTSCKCKVCEHVSEKGLIITDESHARYLYDIEVEFTMSGHPTMYFDTKEEAENYEKSDNKMEIFELASK